MNAGCVNSLIIRVGGCIVLALSVIASAQTTRPATTQTSSLERQPIRRVEPDRAPSSTQRAPAVLQSSGLDAQRVLLALTVVLGLIVVLWIAARRLFPTTAARRSSSIVRVLSRSVISPKQQILLVQVGRRVIVVGDSGAQMTALAEIGEEEEVSDLVAQLDSEKPAPSRAFGSLFGRARETFEQPDQTEPDAPPTDLGFAHAREEIGGLIDRVKGFSQQFRKS